MTSFIYYPDLGVSEAKHARLLQSREQRRIFRLPSRRPRLGDRR